MAGGVATPVSLCRDALGVAALVAAVLLLTSIVDSGVWLTFLLMVLYAALLSQAWNILAGFGGQFSFGHALFFGCGAYVQALAQMSAGVNAWLALLLAVLAACAVAAAVGALSFRYGLKGSYFALVTLAFAEVFRIGAVSVDFTGGGVGLMLPLQGDWAQMQFVSRKGFVLIALALLALAMLCTAWLRHSRFGAQLQAVRDNEDAARAVGVDPFKTKLYAIVLSAAFMGAGGALYLQIFQYIDPAIAFGPATSVEALVGAIVGGLGTLWGPLLGAAALHVLAEATRNLFGQLPGLNMVIYGCVLLLIVVKAPKGVSGWVSGWVSGGVSGGVSALVARIKGARRG